MNAFGGSYMTFVVKSSEEDVIALPEHLLALLDPHEGDEIKMVVEGKSLRLTPLEQFLALKDVLGDDDAFDAAIETINRGWQTWPTSDTV
jgi:hypothetical protein